MEGPQGRRFWGRFGAAGLLVHDPERGILLQHRVEWSHFGGTWGIPGGARRLGEDALSAAVRESAEEAGVPPTAVRTRFTSVLDLGFWSYTTVAVRVADAFDPVVGDAESIALQWVPPDEVDALPLHPGFAAAWPMLRGSLESRVSVVVDAANVVGSRPDGWWRDRRGAAERLLAALATLARSGIPASELQMPLARWWPQVIVVVEGQARSAQPPSDAPDTVTVRRAARDGDQAIVDVVAELRGDQSGLAGGAIAASEPSSLTVVVTADRELRRRVTALGAESRGPGWLLSMLPQTR